MQSIKVKKSHKMTKKNGKAKGTLVRKTKKKKG